MIGTDIVCAVRRTLYAFLMDLTVEKSSISALSLSVSYALRDMDIYVTDENR